MATRARRRTTTRRRSVRNSAMAKRLEKANNRMAAGRRRRAAEKKKLRHTVAIGVSAYGLGMLQRNGMLERLPSFGDIPRTAIAGAIAYGAGAMVGGKFSDYAYGMGDAALAVTMHGMATGTSVAGSHFDGTVGRMRTTAPHGVLPTTTALERDLQQQLQSVSGDHESDFEDVMLVEEIGALEEEIDALESNLTEADVSGMDDPSPGNETATEFDAEDGLG